MNARLSLAVLGLLGSASAHAITFVGSTTSLSPEASSRTPDEPVGVQQGDLILAVCSTSGNDDGDWTIPMGFTEIDQIAGVGGTQRDVVIAWTIRGASAGSYTFSYDGTEGAMRCILAAFRDVDTSTPFDVTYSQEDHYLATNNSPNDAPQPITTVTDGAWVLAVQVRVGDTATTTVAPSGYTELVDYFGANPEVSIASKEVSSAGEETPGTWSHTGADFADTSIFTLALRPEPVVPEYTSGPTVSATTNGYTVSGTITGSGTLTVYAVACLPASSDASAAQVKAGDCDGDVDAEIAESEVWTSGVADSFALTKTGALVRHKVCVVASDGVNDTAVTCTTANRNAASGKSIVTLDSVSSTSPFAVQSDSTGDTTEDSAEIAGMTSTAWLQPGMRVNVSAGFDCSPCVVEAVTPTSITLEEPASSTESNVTVALYDYFDPAVAAGDIVEIDNATSEGDSVTLGVDGNLIYPDSTGGAHATVDYCIQDVSGSGVFTVPNCWSSFDALHFFNSRPEFGPDLGVGPLLLYQGSSVSVNLPCSDPEGQSVTVTSRTSPPSGLSIVSNVLSGTPDTEDESGTDIVLDCADEGFLFATPRTITTYVTDDEISMPDLSGGDVDDAILAMMNARPWLGAGQITVTYECSVGAQDDDVVGQFPAASETIDATETVSVVAARSSICVLLRRRR